MKRFFQFIGFLLLGSVIYAGGAYDLSHTDPRPTPTPVETPAYQPAEEEPVQTELMPAIVDYGAVNVIKHNNDPLHAYIRYPQAGNETDAVLSEWAHNTYNEMVIGFSAMQQTDPSILGEINVQFDSYLFEDRYAGIFQHGEFSYSLTAEPEEILKTFNIDILSNKFLETFDIFDPEQVESVLTLLNYRMLVEHPSTDGYLEFMDESWLSQVVIGNDGIIVVLPQNTFLPEFFTTMTVTLPYMDLGTALRIRGDTPYTPTPDHTPDPTEEPPPPVDVDPPPLDDDESFPADDEEQPPEDDDESIPADDDESLPADDEVTPPEDDEELPPEDDEGPVIAEAPPQSDHIDPTKPMIAISFDDGPGMYTSQFLDLFEKYNIRATFCTVGNLVNTQREQLKRAVEMDCEVIGHSWDHKNLAKMTPEDVKKQLLDTSNTIEAVTGASKPAFRPPYGATSETLKSVAEELGFAIICWSVDPEDWNSKDAQAVYDAVMEQVSDRAVILSHEMYESTLEAYTRLIPELLLEGYQFITVTELLTHVHGTLKPGQVYYSGVPQ